MTQGLAYASDRAPGYSLYYRHSGKAPPASVVVALLTGAAAGSVAAVAYAFADLYIPIIYLNMLLALGLGAFVGFVPALVMRRGRVRSEAVAATVVAAVSAVSYYVCWVGWLYALLLKAHNKPSFFTLLRRPDLVWKLALMLNHNGTWQMSSSSDSNVSGIALWVVWASEAAIIFGTAYLVGRSMLSAEMFCENCNRWCGKPRVLRSTVPVDAAELKRRLETGDFPYVAALGPAQFGTGRWTTFEHHTCPQCRQLNALSAKQATIVKDRRGQQSTKTKTVLNKLLLHPGEAESMQTMAPPMPPTSPMPSTPLAPPMPPLMPPPAPSEGTPTL